MNDTITISACVLWFIIACNVVTLVLTIANIRFMLKAHK